MGGSMVQLNKHHKTRFASKSSRNVHKVSSKAEVLDCKLFYLSLLSTNNLTFYFFLFLSDKINKSKPELNVVKGAKAARLQRNKMIREQKRAAVLKEKRAFSGQTSPPVVVLFGISTSVNLNSLEEDILALLSRERNVANFPAFASSDYKLSMMDIILVPML
ncbi:uncharacterized protein [Primulina eburnea]|uniref:uncharacterized protein n=1 Tax=Primulina eburnea TaxID=1245227 RepID=UPI003C6C8EC2